MKKLSIIALLTIVTNTHAEIKKQKSGYSYYVMQPLFSLGSRSASWKNSLFTHDQSKAVRVTGAVTRSYNSEDMKQYFLCNHKESLTIRGSAHADYNNSDTDIRAQWLGLPNNFEGTLQINPEYKSWGVVLSARHSLKNMFDTSFLEYCSLFVEIPIVHTQTKINLTQDNVSNAGDEDDTVHDIITAFNNPAWKYQKMHTEELEKKEVSEVKLGIATSFLCSNRSLVAITSAVSIPTTKQYKNEYIFEPQTGHVGHPGMASTVHMAVPFSDENSSAQFSLFVDAEHVFLGRTKQYRTFDLKEKPYSRFLLVREKGKEAVPAVNILTRNVRISPYSRFDALIGFKLTTTYATCQIGFGAWGHHKGRIKFTDIWPSTYGIAGSDVEYSASQSTIANQADDDEEFMVIQESDLDIDSALSPSKVIYKAHFSFDFHCLKDKGSFLSTIGCEINIPRNSTNGFKNWALWATLTASF